MQTVRVLVLDTPRFFHGDRLEESGIVVEMTELEKADTWSDSFFGHYRASGRGIAIARQASRNDFDFVIIGNNRGMGFEFAEALSAELRPRTLIVWNSTSIRGEIPGYEQLGYSHFGLRFESPQWILKQLARQETS